MKFDSTNTEEYKTVFAQLIKEWNAKGWSLATSTNYSFRHPKKPEIAIISKSGVDKQYFSKDDFMEVDFDGHAIAAYAGIKPSAETLLHTSLYQHSPEINVIVHSHSKYATILSRKAQNGHILLEGYEFLKAIEGIKTHQTKLEIPVFENSQDIESLSATILETYKTTTFSAYLLASHGMYTWGSNLPQAKRHLEALEFLLECAYKFELLK